MSRIFILIVVLILSIGLSDTAFAQDAGQKTQNLIAALGKTKYKKKEKKNFSFELYIDIKSEAVVKNNVRDYAGVYESPEAGYKIDCAFRLTAKSKEAVTIPILTTRKNEISRSKMGELKARC